LPQWICSACAVEYPDTAEPPLICPICRDDRQYVPRAGQAWTSLERLSADGHGLAIAEAEAELFAITTVPEVGIGQRALLLRTDSGNLLWDPVGFVDEAGAQQVRDLGGAAVIAASHPHMFGAQVAWSRALGGAPVLVADADRSWVQRTDPVIRYWSGAAEVLPGVTLVPIGGHFAGSAVVHWAGGAEGRGVLLAGDTIFPGPNGETVSFMRSFPNKIPLSAAVVDRVADSATERPFDRLYGNFDGDVVAADARAVVRRSADLYMTWVRGDFDHLT
jgi:glyoxylase-like metal-dependent hydrolase (beta-lactamase superfamily II)